MSGTMSSIYLLILFVITAMVSGYFRTNRGNKRNISRWLKIVEWFIYFVVYFLLIIYIIQNSTNNLPLISVTIIVSIFLIYLLQYFLMSKEDPKKNIKRVIYLVKTYKHKEKLPIENSKNENLNNIEAENTDKSDILDLMMKSFIWISYFVISIRALINFIPKEIFEANIRREFTNFINDLLILTIICVSASFVFATRTLFYNLLKYDKFNKVDRNQTSSIKNNPDAIKQRISRKSNEM